MRTVHYNIMSILYIVYIIYHNYMTIHIYTYVSTHTHTERWEGGGESRTDITPNGLSSSLVVMGSLIKLLRYHLNFFFI